MTIRRHFRASIVAQIVTAATMGGACAGEIQPGQASDGSGAICAAAHTPLIFGMATAEAPHAAYRRGFRYLLLLPAVFSIQYIAVGAHAVRRRSASDYYSLPRASFTRRYRLSDVTIKRCARVRFPPAPVIVGFRSRRHIISFSRDSASFMPARRRLFYTYYFSTHSLTERHAIAQFDT